MPRYIDADALQEAFDNPPIECTLDCWYEACLENAPTIDAEPVRRGHWINGNCGDYVCSVCGWAFSDELPYMARKYDAETEEIMRYCMHCGAKMDGGKK